jgi:cyclomaltodextrinase
VTLVVEKRRLEGNYDVLEYNELARVPLARTARADARERWSGHFRSMRRPSTATGSR